MIVCAGPPHGQIMKVKVPHSKLTGYQHSAQEAAGSLVCTKSAIVLYYSADERRSAKYLPISAINFNTCPFISFGNVVKTGDVSKLNT